MLRWAPPAEPKGLPGGAHWSCRVRPGLGNTPTTSVRRLISLLSRSIIRPSVMGQASRCRGRSMFELLQVCGEGLSDAAAAGGFAVPAAGGGVGVQVLDVGERAAQGVGVLGAGDVVVAGFADVGLRAGAGCCAMSTQPWKW